ncbi:MAG: oligosaccharide flippase family protein [Candidatus Nitrotoga sp.]
MNLVHHSIWRGTKVVFLGKVFSVLGILLLSGVLARVLPSHDMGAFFLTSSLVGLMAIICQLGLNQSVVRNIAQAIGRGCQSDARSIAYTSLLYAFVAILVVVLILSGGVLSLIWGVLLNEGSQAPLALLVFAWIALTTLQSLLGEIFRGMHAIGKATFFGVQSGTSGTLSLAISLLIMPIFMLMGRTLTLNLAIASLVLGQLVCVCIAAVALSRQFHPLRNDSIPANHRYRLSVPVSLMFTGLLIFVVGQIDLWVLGFLRSEEEVAIYGAASTLVKYISSVNLLLSAVIPATVAELYAKRHKPELEKLLRGTALISTLFALSMALVFWVFAGEILATIFGAHFAVAAPALIALTIGHIVNAFTGNCGVLLIMAGKDRVMLSITLVFGVITGVLSLVLGNHYGAFGVAIASSIGVSGLNLIMWLSARHYLGIWTHAEFNRTSLNRFVTVFEGVVRKASQKENLRRDQTRGVFANGIWKSGNHLILKLISKLGIQEEGVGIAASSIVGKYFLVRSLLRGAWLDKSPVLIGTDIPVSVSRIWIKRSFSKLDNTCISGHAAYSDQLVDTLREQQIKIIQIVRDPRDIVVSLAYWIESQPKYYAYAGLVKLNLQERMQAIITGFNSNGVRIESMATVLDRSFGWITKPKDILVVRFENLVGSRGGGTDEAQREEIEKVGKWLGEDSIQVDAICERLFGGTKTFRAGGVGAWKNEFSPETKKLFDEVVGERLYHWGYK